MKKRIMQLSLLSSVSRRSADVHTISASAHSQPSAVAAKAILGAWQKRNWERLGRELDRVKSLDRTTDCGESERIELLSEISRELRISVEQLPDTSSHVCGALLRHLAAPRCRRKTQLPAMAVAWGTKLPLKQAAAVLQ